MKYNIGQQVLFLGVIGVIIGYQNEKKKIYKVEVNNFIVFPAESSLTLV